MKMHRRLDPAKQLFDVVRRFWVAQPQSRAVHRQRCLEDRFVPALKQGAALEPTARSSAREAEILCRSLASLRVRRILAFRALGRGLSVGCFRRAGAGRRFFWGGGDAIKAEGLNGNADLEVFLQPVKKAGRRRPHRLNDASGYRRGAICRSAPARLAVFNRSHQHECEIRNLHVFALNPQIGAERRISVFRRFGQDGCIARIKAMR